MKQEYKISYFEQSLSRLYVRSLLKDDDGYFDCFVFWGVSEISMSTLFYSDGTITTAPVSESNLKCFEFSLSGGARVLAVSYQKEKCIDFPDSERVQIMNKDI